MGRTGPLSASALDSRQKLLVRLADTSPELKLTVDRLQQHLTSMRALTVQALPFPGAEALQQQVQKIDAAIVNILSQQPDRNPEMNALFRRIVVAT